MKLIKVSIISSLLLTMSTALPLNSSATEIPTKNHLLVERSLENVDNPFLISKDIELGEYATGGIAIFVGGLIVGYVVDGAIKYTTGHSAADWVAMGLSNMEAKIKKYVGNSKSGSIHVSKNGELSGCVTFPCAIKSSIPNAE